MNKRVADLGGLAINSKGTQIVRTKLRGLAAVTCAASIAGATLYAPAAQADLTSGQKGAAGAGVVLGLDAASNAIAASSANRAVQVAAMTLQNIGKGVTAGMSSGVAAGLITFGLDELTSLLFPKPNVSSEISQLASQDRADFIDIQSDLANLQQQINQVGATTKQAVDFSASATCQSALTSADGYVTTIQDGLMGYNSLFDATWWSDNLASQSPKQAQTTAFKQVFSSVAEYNKFRGAINGLASALTDSPTGPNNSLISACADEIAAAAVANANGDASSIVEVGSLENQFFPLLQNLVVEYGTILGVAQVASAAMGQLYMGSTAPDNLTIVPCGATPSSTEWNDPSICKQIVNDVNGTKAQIEKAYRLAGAAWMQATNGVIGTDLYSNTDTTVFANGTNAWVLDIAQYGKNSKQAAALSSTKAGQGPASGVSALSVKKWNGLNFTSATSEDWNNLLRTKYANIPGTGVAGNGGSNVSECLIDATSNIADPGVNGGVCEAPQTTGQYMADAGLLNGGKSVGDNLIIYTGETDTWDPQNGAWDFAVPLQWVGDQFPTGTINSKYKDGNTVPSQSAQSFLDSSFTPNLGTTIVVHDPAENTGEITTSSVFPFVLYDQTGIGDGGYMTNWELTNTYEQVNGKQIFGQVACQDGGGNSQWYQNVPYAASSWVTDRYQIGSPLYCGAYQFYPSSSVDQSLKLTANSDFYRAPAIQLVGYDQAEDAIADEGFNYPSGVYTCNSGIKEMFANGSKSSTSTLLASCTQSWTSTPGYFTNGAQPQYLWPVVQLPATQAPLTENPQWAFFTQGTTGNIGTPAMDRRLFDSFLAENAGIDTGDISVFATQSIGAGGQNGEDAAQFLITNASSNPAKVNVIFEITDGSFTGGPVDLTAKLAGGVAPKDATCTKSTSSAYHCSFTAPVGVGLIGIPTKLTGKPDTSGHNTGVVSVVGSGGTATVGTTSIPGSFGGTFAVDDGPSQFDQDVAAAVGDKDAGSIASMRATLVNTPANEVGKVQDNTSRTAGPYGVKIVSDYVPGSAPKDQIWFQLIGSLEGKTVFERAIKTPSPTVYLPKEGKWTFTITPYWANVEVTTEYLLTQKGQVKCSGPDSDYECAPGMYQKATVFDDEVYVENKYWVDPPNGGASNYIVKLNGMDIPNPTVKKSKDGAPYVVAPISPPAPGTLSVTAPDDKGNPMTVSVSFDVEATPDYQQRNLSNGQKQVAGGSDHVDVTVGPEKAPAPAKLEVTNTVDGKILATWRPTVAAPPVQHYELVATPPSGASPLRFVVPADSTEYSFMPAELGTWQISLTAVNELGDSDADKSSVMVTSAVPQAPANADVTVSPGGIVSASWVAAVARPEVTAYHVGLFDPSGTKVYGEVIPVSPRLNEGVIRLPEFYALGKDSSAGEWTFGVYAENSDGSGASSRASMLLTTGAIRRMEKLNQEVRFLEGGLAATLIGVDRAECAAGLVSGKMATGTCTAGVFTPSSGLMGVFDDAGSSVSHVGCSGAAAGGAITNCDAVSGAVTNGVARLLITQQFAKKPEGSPISVWVGSEKIWESDGPVVNGATVMADHPVMAGTYSVMVVTEGVSPDTGVVSVVNVVAGSARADVPSGIVAPKQVVTVTLSSGEPQPRPTISGQLIGDQVRLTIVNGAAPAYSINIMGGPSDAFLWGSGAPVPAGGTVVATLPVERGVNKFQLRSDIYRVYFQVNVD